MNKDRTLPFSQREGYEPLPVPLQLEELPFAARRAIWNVLYGQITKSKKRVRDFFVIIDPWKTILQDLYLHHDSGALDEWRPLFDGIKTKMRERLERQRFRRVFEFLEFLMQHDSCPHEFIADLSDVFHRFQLAYIIDSGPPPAIFPAATVEEGNELERNLNELRAATGLGGSVTHLQQASKCINDRDWAGSVRESIHAVESVARQIDPQASKSLGAALASLDREGKLHPAFKEAISKLYGYTSDEQGVRHALLDKAQANVTIDEAVFMLGACASFASYLWRKHKATAAS